MVDLPLAAARTRDGQPNKRPDVEDARGWVPRQTPQALALVFDIENKEVRPRLNGEVRATLLIGAGRSQVTP